MTEVEQLREEVEALRQAFNVFKGQHFTPDNYLRYESIPQFVGGVTHLAGSEEIVADRWEYVHPTILGSNGNGTASWSSVSASGAETINALDVTETGKLLGLGVYIRAGATFTGNENVQSEAWVTVDGGTRQDIDLHTLTGGGVINDVGFSLVGLGPFRKYGDPSDVNWGSFEGDCLFMPFNFEYGTSLKVDLRISAESNWGGSPGFVSMWLTVYRARLT